jgi:ABC-type antimicrobial peptide transport system permease subunit
VKHLGKQLGYQIEDAIVTAMTSYMENLKDSFDFSAESLMNVVNANMSAESIQEMLSNVFAGASQTAKGNLKALGYANLDDPATITFYPKDFESKEGVIAILNKYNDEMKEIDENNVVKYTDMVGSLMSSVTDIIDIIGYVLIAFVSVSLVVSSIMIGVITYISVLERRKEIGILRAMGASKRNIIQVFNCETIITGFLAGLIGVVMTWLILIPANAILQYITGAQNLHGFLPLNTAVFLILLSITLTTIGGLLPSKSASKQDPVIALRAE